MSGQSGTQSGTQDTTTDKVEVSKKIHGNRHERFVGTLSTKASQRNQLEKLMAEPEKPVDIPEKQADWRPPDPPEFKRFYMGSSAGAGSEVFHVYRHLRRYEMIRQDWIRDTANKEDKDLEFQSRLAEGKKSAEEKTAKKRVKRLKKKQSKEKDKNKPEKTKVKTDDFQEKEEEKEEESEDDPPNDDEIDDAYENPFIIGGK